MSCSSENESISFYHWKADAEMGPMVSKALEENDCQRVYMHYFDVVQAKKMDSRDDGIFPTYVLDDVDEGYRNLDVVPVIFISNEIFEDKTDHWATFKARKEEKSLVERLTSLIEQISETHFDTQPTELQIDCDWTEGTRDAYFQFLKDLSDYYTLSATIRLHQITYAERTGVPPVASGALMLYNMGDLKDMEANSIIDPGIVSSYVNKSTSYPLTLDLALPLFSQTVIRNNDNEYRLSDHYDSDVLEYDAHFEKRGPDLFEVVQDTSYMGFFLTPGYHLKLEESDPLDIVSSYRIIKKSQLKIKGLIFYHLDEEVMSDGILEEVLPEL